MRSIERPPNVRNRSTPPSPRCGEPRLFDESMDRCDYRGKAPLTRRVTGYFTRVVTAYFTAFYTMGKGVKNTVTETVYFTVFVTLARTVKDSVRKRRVFTVFITLHSDRERRREENRERGRESNRETA